MLGYVEDVIEDVPAGQLVGFPVTFLTILTYIVLAGGF